MRSKVVIVGAGWSGLAAAVSLARDHDITIVDNAPHLGGRARSIKLGKYTVDNGQHIAIGAYSHVLNLLSQLNVKEKEVFERKKFSLMFKRPDKIVCINKFNFIKQILWTKGLSYRQQISLWQGMNKIKKFVFSSDMTVLHLLRNCKQSSDLIDNFWSPITLAALSTPIHRACAKVFKKVISTTFFEQSNHSDWLLPKQDLSKIIPFPASSFINKSGGKIYTNTRVTAINLNNERCSSIVTNKGTMSADYVVIAIPSWQLCKITHEHPLLHETTKQLLNIKSEKITTIYLVCDRSISLPYPMIGLSDKPCQWIFDRSFCGQDRILSAIITGESELDKEQLLQQAIRQIRNHFPSFPQVIASKIICEKRAAFSCNADFPKISIHTPVDNLVLAGDYLHKQYPASLEAAVASGFASADLIRNRHLL